MIPYKEYEERVFNWLMDKNKKDPSFTFSFRRKGDKGAETDYFIGTESANYFALTFWSIPVAYRGASSDLINLVFRYSDNGLKYHFQFFQTRAPHNDQNKFALELIRSLKPKVKSLFPTMMENPATNKMEKFTVPGKKSEYSGLDEMMIDVDVDIALLIPLVESEIESAKQRHPSFAANRITPEKFGELYGNMLKRKEKYQTVSKKINYWIVNGFGAPKITYCLQNDCFVMQFQYDSEPTSDVTRMLNRVLEISEGDKVLLYNKNRYYAWGTFSRADIDGAEEKNLSELIEARDSHDDGVYVYEDAPCFYEDVTLDNGFDSGFGQRLKVDKWEDIHLNGIREPGIAAEIEGVLMDTIHKLKDHTFFEKVQKILATNEPTTSGMDGIRKIDGKSLNRILFGPPGTGKTFSSINRALEIINDDEVKRLDWGDRKSVKALFDKKMLSGQIVFTTFHQSLSYEDFIEGIKPLEPKAVGQPVTYKVVNGILKEFCAQIRSNELLTETQSEIRTINSFEELYVAFQIQLNLMISSDDEGQYPSLPSRRSNVKVLKVVGDTIETIGQTASSIETIQRDKLKRIYDKYKTPEDIKRLMDLRTEIGTDIGWITNYYAIFKALKEFEQAKSKSEIVPKKQNGQKKYVLIIDEINRGNVSQIFGELITLLEDDKRSGKSESLEVTLPYSKSKFSVPPNLYIIGTMNTADRSVEALDTALRRRFSFEEIMPDYTLEQLGYEYAGIKAADLLQTINTRIEKLLDKDHQIGHSYLMLRDDETAEDRLTNAFYKNIIPLLQEYFFGDYAKIGLVLGDGFVRLKSGSSDKNIFASFNNGDHSDFTDKEVFEIVDYRITADYQIKDEKMTFGSALKLLMRK